MDAPIFLFDVDGVLEQSSTFFSENFCKEKNLPTDFFLGYFQNDFPTIVTGGSDARERMALYLQWTELEGKTDEVFEAWFTHGSNIDEDILSLAADLREAGHPVALATNQEAHRVKYLWGTLGLSERFDAAYPSCEMGFKKPDIRYFQAVNRAVYDRFGARQIIFVDDSIENVETSREVDWISYHFDARDPESLSKLNAFLIQYR